jgi:hypothetical protein
MPFTFRLHKFILIWGKITICEQKFKTEVGNDQLEFTGMIDFLNKVYICVYFFLYEYDGKNSVYLFAFCMNLGEINALLTIACCQMKHFGYVIVY